MCNQSKKLSSEPIQMKNKTPHILSTKLNRHLFWDVDFNSIHWDKKYQWIIVRVFERGDVEDIRQCRRYYGDEKVKAALLSAKYIMKHRLPLASAVINEPLKRFRCYTLQQSLPPHYL